MFWRGSRTGCGSREGDISKSLIVCDPCRGSGVFPPVEPMTIQLHKLKIKQVKKWLMKSKKRINNGTVVSLKYWGRRPMAKTGAFEALNFSSNLNAPSIIHARLNISGFNPSHKEKEKWEFHYHSCVILEYTDINTMGMIFWGMISSHALCGKEIFKSYH